MIHKGSCHCGKVACEADCEIGEVVSCNCSICRRKGHLLLFVPLDKFKLTTPRDDLSDYSFGPQRIHHHFCRACGCSPFALGSDPKGNEMAAINVRCLEDVDLDALTIRHFDGRSL
ncbi:MAG TPA: GFA family protein [Gammaproteobacteria bacterium]|nr:GFA family protein [Gammaproteobacteria bacterium]